MKEGTGEDEGEEGGRGEGDFKRDEQYSRRGEKFRELYLFWKRTSVQSIPRKKKVRSCNKEVSRRFFWYGTRYVHLLNGRSHCRETSARPGNRHDRSYDSLKFILNQRNVFHREHFNPLSVYVESTHLLRKDEIFFVQCRVEKKFDLLFIVKFK